MFCPKCGAILVPKKEKNKKVLSCPSCSYTDKDIDKGAKIRENVQKSEDKIEVVGDEEEKIRPLTDAECSKCGHKKAYFWTVQTRAGDEAETRFFECEKCKHRWREY